MRSLLCSVTPFSLAHRALRNWNQWQPVLTGSTTILWTVFSLRRHSKKLRQNALQLCDDLDRVCWWSCIPEDFNVSRGYCMVGSYFFFFLEPVDGGPIGDSVAAIQLRPVRRGSVILGYS